MDVLRIKLRTSCRLRGVYPTTELYPPPPLHPVGFLFEFLMVGPVRSLLKKGSPVLFISEC